LVAVTSLRSAVEPGFVYVSRVRTPNDHINRKGPQKIWGPFLFIWRRGSPPITNPIASDDFLFFLYLLLVIVLHVTSLSIIIQV